MPTDQLDPEVEIQLRAVLHELADDCVSTDATSLLADGRGPRRRWPLVVLAAAVALVVAAITIPLVVRTRDVEPSRPPIPAGVRVPGNWSMITEITPPTGWEVAQREVYLTAEQTILAPLGDTDRKQTCSVVLDTPDPAATPPRGTPATLAGHSGFWVVDENNANQPSFEWEYEPSAWALVDCSGVKDARAMIATVLPGVQRGFTEVRIPFRLAAVPAGFEVKTVNQGGSGWVDDRGVNLGDLENDPGIDKISIRWMDVDPKVTSPTFEPATGSATIHGRPWVYFQQGATPSACLDGRPTICVINDTAGGTRDEVWNRILNLANDLELAPDLNDPSTWPSARDALPRSNR